MQSRSLGRKIIFWIKFWLEPFVLFKRQETFRRSILFTWYFEKERVDEKVILYEINNQLPLHPGVKRLLNEKEYKHIWVIKDDTKISRDIHKYPYLKKVKWQSRDYFKYLASARYLINDLDFPAYFQKKDRQVYVSLLNTLVKNDQSRLSNIQRNLLHVDYLVTDNNKSANKLLEAYQVKDLFCGGIVEAVEFSLKHLPLRNKQVQRNKQNLLFYCGGFLNNGITSSAINLLNHIDYSKYNVVVLEKQKTDPIFLENIQKINKEAHLLYRVGRMNLTLGEYYRNKYVMNKGLRQPHSQGLIPSSLYEREYKRLFGNVHFDVAIDFSGYVPFWSLVFTHGSAARKVIYQHNDMLEESKKVVDNQLKHKAKMDIIFPLYHKFDKVISVAKFTRDLNVRNLQEFIPEQKAAYVHNCIDATKVLNQANQTAAEEFAFPIPDKGNINFLNIGRLSPEKDHEKLIRAFATISLKYDKTRLYICGDGPLMDKLVALRDDLGLQDKVIFTGHISNPFYLFRLCDCFILSSNHEGQPMVLLEALILRKPVIATDIAGSRSVLEGRQSSLVSNSENGLVGGMDAFIRQPYTPEYFDYDAYNQQALKMFYKEVCGVPMKTNQTKNISIHERSSSC